MVGLANATAEAVQAATEEAAAADRMAQESEDCNDKRLRLGMQRRCHALLWL